jgi:hypothetical protein
VKCGRRGTCVCCRGGGVAHGARGGRTTQRKGVTITIWDYFVNSPKERAALMQVANAWAKSTGNTVVNPGDITDCATKYPLAAQAAAPRHRASSCTIA